MGFPSGSHRRAKRPLGLDFGSIHSRWCILVCVPETTITLVIPGLDRIDRLALAGQFKSDEISFEDKPSSSGRHGELITAAVVLGTLGAINVLAAYLLKDRDRGRLKRTIVARLPDGSEREETVEVDLDSSHAPKAEVLKQLGSIAHIDVSSLLKVDGGK
jgi:hypothetical protein